MMKFSPWRSAFVAALLAGGALTAAPAMAQQAQGTELAQNNKRARDYIRERAQAAGERNAGAQAERAAAWEARRAQVNQARQARQEAATSRGSQGGARPQVTQQRTWRGQERVQNQTRRQEPRNEGVRNWRDRDTVRRDDNRVSSDSSRNDVRRGDYWRHNDSRGERWHDGTRYGDSRIRGDYRRWNASDWRRDRRYDWRGYRNYNREVYRIGRYNSPYRGYAYRRLNTGLYLEPLFYGNNYWISDPWEYRLPPVYGPYRWVRYYDDVLLIDIYSGEVVDVIYNFFW